MLPAIAVLHVRHALVRPSGAVLGTIAGTATVVVGLAGAVNVDLRPAALLILGIWWWTIGKTWAATALLPRALGVVTAALGALAVTVGLYSSFSIGLAVVRPGVPEIPVGSVTQLALGAWLLALSATLWTETPRTSP